MIIDFGKINESVIHNFRGGEKDTHTRMHMDDMNKIMRGSLCPGASIGMHKHETGSEIIYILEGEGTVIFDGETEKVTAGLCHYCPKGHSHSLINDSNGELVFFAVVPEQ